MTTVITFNYASFIANPQFALYANPALYPQALLQAWWNNAINIISDNPYCGNIQGDQRYYAIELMLAHLMFLQNLNAQGQVPGLMQNATIDKVSVALTPPPLPNQWQWWMNLSPYGQQLLAMLKVNSVGGDYIGGSAPRAGFNGFSGGIWPWYQ
jgi:hypothetical protein